MTKTINFELSKRLDKLGLLKDVETEYIYTKRDIGFGNIDYDIIEGKYFNLDDGDIKTLTTDEAIEFLPKYINMELHWRGYLRDDKLCYLSIEPKDKIGKTEKHIEIKYKHFSMGTYIYSSGDTLLEAIEKMINYLLDNNLIGPTNKN